MLKRFKQCDIKKHLKTDTLKIHSYKGFKNIPAITGHVQKTEYPGDDEIAGWFLGNKAENIEIFSELITEAINNIAYGRRSFHPEDPVYITESKKTKEGYLSAIQSLKDNFYRLSVFLNTYSAPFPSMRYQGHMNWDVTMPAIIGYFTAMLQNQNNVAFQGSPATTFLEILAATDIAHMVGFDFNTENSPWGHITCDGSVANLEAMWSARELKFFPIGVKVALKKEYKNAWENLKIPFGKTNMLFQDLDDWQLLNLKCDVILSIPSLIAQIEHKDESEVWEHLASTYSVNTLGLTRFYQDEEFLGKTDIGTPTVLVPSSKHYSWPKAASLLGIGHSIEGVKPDDPDFKFSSIVNVFVDTLARMDINQLNTVLEKCRELKKPVLLTVAVIGSTEESAVDPLSDILETRNSLRSNAQDPFDFNVHADAAWGGYLISAIRKDFDLDWPDDDKTSGKVNEDDLFIEDTKNIPLSDHVITQLQNIRNCDSVTIDPHKWGYIPYPSGCLCYRNGNMINLVTFGAPYIGSESSKVEGIGESGVEGSKSGASAAAVFLSHSVIRPSYKGYGKIMNQAVLNARIFYTYIAGMADENDPFFIVPFNGIPDGPEDEDGINYIINTFINTEKTLAEILEDPNAMKYIKTIGPDQNFANYIFNYYTDSGKQSPNTDPQKLIQLHDILFEKVYPQSDSRKPVEDYTIMITKTTFHRSDYGDCFMNTLAERLRLEKPQEVDAIPCMRSVIMDPWVIETTSGKDNFNFFKEVFIPELRKAVIESITELQKFLFL